MKEICPPHGRPEQILAQKLEELLELIWTLREDGKDRVEDVLQRTAEEDPAGLLERLVQRGDLVLQREEGRVQLTPQGERRAAQVVRRFRLSRRLLVDVFDLADEEAVTQACEFEHILSPAVTDSVCTFLGHPTAAPDGRPIPRGECCARYRLDVKPVVIRLSEMTPGESGKIAFMTPGSKARLDRLGSMGLMPGSAIRLRQRHPSFVLELGETTLAVDEEIARDIFVKRAASVSGGEG